MNEKVYAAIDLKSFYASVECVERGLDPLTTNLVVADAERSEKTICLAVSPSLKQYGIPGRARLFEIIQRVKEINRDRRMRIPRDFVGASVNDIELKRNPMLRLDYVVATPRMAHYMDYSTNVYEVYMKYVSPEDIHVYSIDEVFIDMTGYLKSYGASARELVMRIIRDILKTTGITATGGIGTNLYLAKVAMDIVAKHIPADKDGVRIASLDEQSYRRQLWCHRPLTDFWRVGKSTAAKLERNGMRTMGDVSRVSLKNEDLLFSLFGVNAELLIDHAWGRETATIQDIRQYRPQASSIGQGQVLMKPYDKDKARLIVKEMADALALDLTYKNLVADSFFLHIGYDASNIEENVEWKKDWYGRMVPKSAKGTARLPFKTCSGQVIRKAIVDLYDVIADASLTIRRVDISAIDVSDRLCYSRKESKVQMDLFNDVEGMKEEEERLWQVGEKDIKAQEAMLEIKRRFGKNAIVTGKDLLEGAMTKERNKQIGGHKA